MRNRAQELKDQVSQLLGSSQLLYGFTNKNPTRTNSYLDASNALKPLERHGSMDATLYNEIIRLQRLLEQKGEEVESAKRQSDAVSYRKNGVDVPASATLIYHNGIQPSPDFPCTTIISEPSR